MQMRTPENPGCAHSASIRVKTSLHERQGRVGKGTKGGTVFAMLQATHGNLEQEQSYGFVMTTSRDLPPYIRSEDVWQMLGTPQLRNMSSKP